MHRLQPFMDSLALCPKTWTFYEEALTHKSSLRNIKDPHNERLEFLGDRVLGLVMAEWLFNEFQSDPEGDLAKRQAVLISRVTLLKIAQTIKLFDYLLLSKALLNSEPARVESLYANALEAFIAALYLDQGLLAAKAFIHAHWQPYVDGVRQTPKDAKSTLQEWAQGRGLAFPYYEIIETIGPDHAPKFKIKVSLDGLGHEIVAATSRRQGEQMAAQELLKRIKTT